MDTTCSVHTHSLVQWHAQIAVRMKTMFHKTIPHLFKMKLDSKGVWCFVQVYLLCVCVCSARN